MYSQSTVSSPPLPEFPAVLEQGGWDGNDVSKIKRAPFGTSCQQNPRIPLWYTANPTPAGPGPPSLAPVYDAQFRCVVFCSKVIHPSSLHIQPQIGFKNWLSSLSEPATHFLERNLLSLDRNLHPLIFFTTSLGFTFGILASRGPS